MNLKKFYKILSAIIVIPFGFYVFLWAITDYRYFSFDGFIFANLCSTCAQAPPRSTPIFQ